MTNDVLIYSDGSSLGNPGPGGYGVIMKWKDKELKLSQGFRKTTNNRMELLGPIIALQKLKKSENVLITTDSRYVIDGIEKGWAKKWQKNNWMRKVLDLFKSNDDIRFISLYINFYHSDF